MPSEAQNRDNAFRSSLSYPSLTWDLLSVEYGMRAKLWKQAMYQGLQWQGLPGFRSIGGGAARLKTLGGGPINRLGVQLLKPLQGGLRMIPGLQDVNLVQQGISGFGPIGKFFGDILGGTQTNVLKIGGVPESSRAAVTKALETNWKKALFSKKVVNRSLEGLTEFGSTPEAIRAFRVGAGTKTSALAAKSILTRKTAWKFALTQRFLPAAVWANNFALAASFVSPIFRAAGEFIGTQINEASRFIDRFDRRTLEFGGKIHQSYMNRAGVTERQRALQELRTSRTNARTFVGGEASLYHS